MDFTIPDFDEPAEPAGPTLEDLQAAKEHIEGHHGFMRTLLDPTLMGMAEFRALEAVYEGNATPLPRQAASWLARGIIPENEMPNEWLPESWQWRSEHEGMMTRRECLEFVVDIFLSPDCMGIKDGYDLGYAEGMLRALNMRTYGSGANLFLRAAHELALMMNAERSD